MKQLRTLARLVGSHMCGSPFAGICAFFLASAFGGPKSRELVDNKFVAGQLANSPPASGVASQ
jgi:hypothetical protein